MQMLVAMSSMLNFSLEEKEMLGLVEKKGAERKNSDVNIGAKLINFLMATWLRHLLFCDIFITANASSRQ